MATGRSGVSRPIVRTWPSEPAWPEVVEAGCSRARHDGAAVADLSRLVRSAVLCSDASVRASGGSWRVDGDPMEAALVVLGLKAGLTSFAKMKQMGVTTPVFGFVSDYMARPDGGEIKHSELIHPKVEAEICIVTKAPLKGPGCNVAAVMAATDFVIPGVEIIDSRYKDFKFDLKSVIADNTSAARFVVGGSPTRGTDWTCAPWAS